MPDNMIPGYLKCLYIKLVNVTLINPYIIKSLWSLQSNPSIYGEFWSRLPADFPGFFLLHDSAWWDNKDVLIITEMFQMEKLVRSRYSKNYLSLYCSYTYWTCNPEILTVIFLYPWKFTGCTFLAKGFNCSLTKKHFKMKMLKFTISRFHTIYRYLAFYGLLVC